MMEKTDAIHSKIISCIMNESNVRDVLPLIEDQKKYLSGEISKEINSVNDNLEKFNKRFCYLEEKVNANESNDEQIDTMVADIRNIYAKISKIDHLIDHDPLLHPQIDEETSTKIRNSDTVLIPNNQTDPEKVFGELYQSIFPQ
jgi:hypothetical protein